MAIAEGGKSYGARRNSDAAHPLTRPYAKSAADTTVIRRGHPVVLTSGGTGGNLVNRAVLTSGAVSSTRLLGFASHDEYSVDNTNYGDFGFGILPKATIPVASGAGTGLEQIQVNLADGVTEFQYAVASGITVDQSLVGQDAGIVEEDATNHANFVLDTGASQKLVVITSVNPSDIGIPGGRVTCDILPSVKQWPNPN